MRRNPTGAVASSCLTDQWTRSQLPEACMPRPRHRAQTFPFLSPVLPWFETKHINTFRQLDCMILGIPCVYFLLPHTSTSPQPQA